MMHKKNRVWIETLNCFKLLCYLNYKSYEKYCILNITQLNKLFLNPFLYFLEVHNIMCFCLCDWGYLLVAYFLTIYLTKTYTKTRYTEVKFQSLKYYGLVLSMKSENMLSNCCTFILKKYNMKAHSNTFQTKPENPSFNPKMFKK